MSNVMENLEKRVMDTRNKIKTTRREITGGVAEDKIMEIGKKAYKELDEDLEKLHEAIKKQRAEAKERRAKIFDEIEEDISAAHTRLRNKRREITGGHVEDAAKDAAHFIKEKSEVALKELGEDLDRISEKLKRAKEED